MAKRKISRIGLSDHHAFGVGMEIDTKGLVRLGKALHRIGDGRGVERAMKAGLSEGSRKLKTRTKIMLQGITGIKLQRRITRGMRQIPARRSTDGMGWEAGLRVFDRHTRITAAYYVARWNRSMPGVYHQAWGRGQIADGAFMIPGKAPAFKRTSAARFPVRVLWGPSMAREMDRNSDKVSHISRRIVKFNVLPTARRLMKVAIIEAKQRYRL